MKKLTKVEQSIFDRLDSNAKTYRSQIAAIAKAGFAGVDTLAKFRAIREQAFQLWKSKQEQAPAWALRCRYNHSCKSGWEVDRAGRTFEVSGAGSYCHYLVNWGRDRKHQAGKATAFPPKVRTETNGKSGWDCVVNRYADYLAVASPDLSQVYFSAQIGTPGTVHSVRNKRFICHGKVWSFGDLRSNRYCRRLRDQCKLLRRHGFAAIMRRQTLEMIRSGSGDTTRNKRDALVCVVPDLSGGFYHVDVAQSPEVIRVRLQERELIRLDSELGRLLDAGQFRDLQICRLDSYRAGNCKAGTDAFISSHGLLGRTHATAEELLASANGSTQFVRAACLVAIRRSRIESERGYCLLSDHV